MFGSMEEAFATALRNMQEKADAHRQEAAAALERGDAAAAAIAADRAAGCETAAEQLRGNVRGQRGGEI